MARMKLNAADARSVLIQRLETVATVEFDINADQTIAEAAYATIGRLFDKEVGGGERKEDALQFSYGGATFHASVSVDDA